MMRTSLIGPFCSGDKVMLAEMSLLGRFWLGQEALFFRRCHAKQFTAAASDAYRAEWFSGRRDTRFAQRIRLLLAYSRAPYTAELTVRQRYTCLHTIARRAISRGQPLRRLTGAVVGT